MTWLHSFTAVIGITLSWLCSRRTTARRASMPWARRAWRSSLATPVEKIAWKDPQTVMEMADKIRQRVEQARLAFALRRIPIFGGLEAHILRDLESELEMVTLLGGETLFREQEMGEALCIVLSGRLHLVALASELYDEVVSEVGHGELVGETTVGNNRPYGVTATAVRDTNLARLSRTGFHRFLTKHPVAATKVLTSRLLSGLESSRSSRPKRSVTSITVVPTSRDVPLRDDLRSAHRRAFSFRFRFASEPQKGRSRDRCPRHRFSDGCRRQRDQAHRMARRAGTGT